MKEKRRIRKERCEGIAKEKQRGGEKEMRRGNERDAKDSEREKEKQRGTKGERRIAKEMGKMARENDVRNLEKKIFTMVNETIGIQKKGIYALFEFRK